MNVYNRYFETFADASQFVSAIGSNRPDIMVSQIEYNTLQNYYVVVVKEFNLD